MSEESSMVLHFLDKNRIGENVPGQYAHELALLANERYQQLKEALSIIKDLADLHDSYIGYLSVHNNYNEPAALAIQERIQTLKLKQ